jgi:hypothetical protein
MYESNEQREEYYKVSIVAHNKDEHQKTCTHFENMHLFERL